MATWQRPRQAAEIAAKSLLPHRTPSAMAPEEKRECSALRRMAVRKTPAPRTLSRARRCPKIPTPPRARPTLSCWAAGWVMSQPPGKAEAAGGECAVEAWDLVVVPAALEEAQAAPSAQEEVRAKADRVEGSAGVAEVLGAVEEERVVGVAIARR